MGPHLNPTIHTAGGAAKASWTSVRGTRPPAEGDGPLIKVAVAVEPPFLRNMLLDLLTPERDITIVTASSPSQPDGPAADPVDVIVVACDGAAPDSGPLRALYRSPRSRVLGLTPGDGQGFLYELRPQRTSLGELSREGLLSAIRQGTDPNRP